MLILLLLTSIVFQTIIGMDNDPNSDVTEISCEASCPKSSKNKVCPKRCEYYLTGGTEICWKCFCKICNQKFNNKYQSNWGDEITHSTQFQGYFKEQNFAIINNQIQELKSKGPDLEISINTNLNIIKGERIILDDVNLLKLFNNMLLKYTLEICNIVNPGDQTGFKETLCLKAKNLKILLDKIENPHLRDIYFRADVEMENLAKNFRSKYFKKSKICKYITNTKYNELSKIISKETKSNLQLEKNLQKLNARINAQLQKGIQLLSDYKSRYACSLYLPYFDDSSNIKKIMIENMAVSIPQLERQLNEIACESTIAIREMCAYGGFVDCHTIKPALSIFAVEIFITAIFDFGFQHLLGKWPFSISPIHFHKGESSNTRN